MGSREYVMSLDLEAAIDEAVTIGERAGVAVHLSHLKAAGRDNWGKSREIVAAIRAGRKRGLALTGDQYAYAASSTALDVLFPSRALSIGRRDFAAKLEHDSEFRQRMTQALHATMKRSGFDDLAYAQIATAPNNSNLNGLRLPAAAAKVLGATTADRQAELAIQLMIDAKGARVGMIYHKMHEDDVERIMRETHIAVASDAGIRLHRTAAKPHPRGAGNNPRVLGRYVSERGVIPLGLALRKMSGLPAEIFGLTGRGLIRVGAFADLTVFDSEQVEDRATYDQPEHAPIGIRLVVVNGEIVVQHGEHTNRLPGHILRGPGADQTQGKNK